MIPIRHSPDQSQNPRFSAQPRRSGRESNRAWLARTRCRCGVLLLGGASLVDFRLRVAQSYLRSDLRPSHWSLAGLLLDARKGTFLSVPLGHIADPSAVPAANAVEVCALADYDDPQRFPNVAVVDYHADPRALQDNVARVCRQRGVVDLVALVIPWLAFVWGVGRQGNPLLDSCGLPSSAFVEAVFGLSGVELTPGVAPQASCPEAIWQSAKWWGSYYERTAAEGGRDASHVPRGCFVVDQSAAAVRDAASRGPSGRARRSRRS